MTQARGGNSQLLLQYQTAARTEPSPAAAKVIPFTSYAVGRDARRTNDPTVSNSPLDAKSGLGDPVVGGPITSILDLRTIGYWLKLLLGQPNTTGTTLKTHTFPINLTDRPYALLELGHTDISKFYRTLDAHVNKLSWDITNSDQNISLDIIAGAEVDPVPTTVFDAAPTAVGSFRACSASGVISNGVDGTLGQIVGGSIEISNNMKGVELADGQSGYGLFEQGVLSFSGKIRAVFDGASAYALARAGTSTRLKLVSAATIGADTFDLTVDMPYVELIEKAVPKQGASGLYVELDWKAHRGATLPTVELRNDVASF